MTVVRPVEAPAVEDLSSIPVPFDACASCGFLGVRPPGVQDGGLPQNALMTERLCPRCGHRGPPVEFEAREDYVAFVRALHATPSRR